MIMLEEDTAESKEMSPIGGAQLEARRGAGVRGYRLEAQLAVSWGAGAEGGTREEQGPRASNASNALAISGHRVELLGDALDLVA
jgi:hypothetical protein